MLLEEQGILLFLLLHFLQAVFVLLAVGANHCDYWVGFSVEGLPLDLLAELGDDGNVLRLEFALPIFIDGYVKF